MKNTRLEEGAPRAQAFLGPHQLLTYLRELLAAAVFQFTALEQVPDPLLRVQLRSVGGKPLQMHSLGGTCCEKLLDDLGPVDGSPVPNHEQLARNLAQQQA